MPTRHVRKGVSAVALVITVPEDPDEKMAPYVDNAKKALSDADLAVVITLSMV